MHPFSAYYFSAEVAKSVDAVDSKSTVEIRAGSSPAFGTIKYRANKKPPKGGFFVSGICPMPLPAHFTLY
jgi:hypothetical protein